MHWAQMVYIGSRAIRSSRLESGLV
jgi:hypothetical protein